MKSPKTFLLVFTFISLSLTSYAQVQKGDSNIGVNLFVSGSIAPDQVFEPTGTLVLGYEKYISNHLSFTAGPAMTFATGLADISLLVQMNWIFLNTKVTPYAGVGFDTNTTISTFQDQNGNDVTTTINNIRLGGHGGLKFFFTERANLDFRIRYNHNMSTSIIDDTGSSIGTIEPVGGILQITVGFNVIIGRKGT